MGSQGFRIVPSPDVFSDMANLEQVFKISGVPTFTLVEPLEYSALLVALRTPGRGVVIEGPSGIGKTTAVSRALDQLQMTEVMRLSARRPDDVELIRQLPNMRPFGTVLVDDFHRLPAQYRNHIADLMKLMADEETTDSKLILVGINKAGESLIKFAHDLNNRIDIIPLETNPDDKVEELLEKGEAALNVELNVKRDVVIAANGSFYIAQMLSHQSCLDANILSTANTRVRTEVSFESVKGKVHDRLARTFHERTKRFCRGPRFRREGRAPYLRLLHLLAQSQEWTLPVDQVIAANPNLAGSISQIVDKGYLESHIERDEELTAVLHFDSTTNMLSVEDPQYVYYLRSIPWARFAQEVGFQSLEVQSKYDFALSFAGADRSVASKLNDVLKELEFEVFYDRNEQHRILAADIEDYLRPIYQSDAAYIVALLGPEYPKRIWTKFESESFKQRFAHGAVIPIWLTTAPPGMFDETTQRGGFEFDPSTDVDAQIAQVSDLLRRKIGDIRSTPLPLPGEQGILPLFVLKD